MTVAQKIHSRDIAGCEFFCIHHDSETAVTGRFAIRDIIRYGKQAYW